MPETSPRRATNQRPTTVATSAIAIDPVPSPTMTPHSRTSCHDAVMNTVSPLPAATMSSAIDTTRRTPKRSISAAANGAVIPNRARLTDSAAEIVPIDQPNSARSGSIITLGVERKAAAPSSARNVAAAAHQAGWTRRVGGAGTAVWVTAPASQSPPTEKVARKPTCAKIRP